MVRFQLLVAALLAVGLGTTGPALAESPGDSDSAGEVVGTYVLVTEGLKVARLKHSIKHFTRRSYAEHLEKCDRYTELQARRWHEQGRRASFWQLLLRPPARFLRSYIALGGFLDGVAGLHIAYLAAYYTFLKQARLWELNQGRTGDEATPTQDESIRKAA